MPALFSVDSPSALASERLAIALTRHQTNREELHVDEATGRVRTGMSFSCVAKSCERIRRRPPRYLPEAFKRRADLSYSSPLRSIWSHCSVILQLARRSRKVEFGVPSSLLQGGRFDDLYRLHLGDQFDHFGTVGPIDILAPARRALWMAYLAKFNAGFSFPTVWSRDKVARHFYWSVLHLHFVQGRGRRTIAPCTLDFSFDPDLSRLAGFLKFGFHIRFSLRPLRLSRVEFLFFVKVCAPGRLVRGFARTAGSTSVPQCGG